MSKVKRPIKRINSYIDNYGLDTPRQRATARLLREIFEVTEKNDKKN